MASKVSELAVALDHAAHRLQFASARQQAAQRLKRDPAAPTLRQPSAERLGGIVSGGAERQGEGRRQRELIGADFTLDLLLLAERHRHAAAQARTAEGAVEVVEGQPVAGELHARRQADVLRQRIRRLEIEQRPEIGAANFQGETGLGLLRPWFGGAFRFGLKSRPRDLCLEAQRRAPRARRAALELRRAVARRHRAIEAEQDKQGAALLGRQFRTRSRRRCFGARRDRCPGSPRWPALAVIVMTPLSCRRIRDQRWRAPGRDRTARHSR